MGIIKFLPPESGNFIVKILEWLVNLGGEVWVGVILFTLLLKLISLPLDYFSKASMRKNNIKMEAMREDLEKLQKQYANDKALYNQKMMALYKKNGYSMWGSCLPTILTLVIFIVAINGFTSYSTIENRHTFYEMSKSYNSVIYEGFTADGELAVQNADGTITFNDKAIFDLAIASENGEVITEQYKITAIRPTDIEGVITDGKITYQSQTETGCYIVYQKDVVFNGADYKFTNRQFTVDIEKLAESSLTVNGKDYTAYDGEKQTALGEDYNQVKVAENFVLEIQQQRSAEKFREKKHGFLWVKNIWVADNALKHPIDSSWDNFKSAHKYEDDSVDAMDADDYANMIAKLDLEQKQANGYFILVILNAGSYLLMQLIQNKSQKAQMELQTVDGQGAQTQKMMMWIMPIMMAFFAFMYTAAFSIYIVLSSCISMLTTFLINLIVDKKYKNVTAEKDKVIRGRVYEAPKEEEKPKEKKAKFSLFKKEEEPKQDFLSGKIKKKK